MKSAANISASNSGVVPLLFTARSLLTESEARQPLEQRTAELTPPDVPPKDRTAMLSSGIDCSRATSCSTSLMATRKCGATDSLRSTNTTMSSEVSSERVKLRKLRTTSSLSTTAKSDFVTVASGRLFSSVAKNVTRTSETALRYAGRPEEPFVSSAAEAYVKTNRARSTDRICQCANIAVH